MTTVLGGLLLTAAARPLCAQPSSEPSFTGIGDLPGGLFNSLAWSVSANGGVVVGDSTKGGWGEYEPIRWDASNGILPLGSQWRGSALGASGSGSILSGAIILTLTGEGFRWTAEEGIIRLGDLPGGIYQSSALGVSARGDIIVGYSNSALGNEATRWTAETGLVGLGDLPGGDFQSTALAISADGQTLVGAGRSQQGQEAMRWTAERGMVGLGDLPGGNYRSVAWAVSADGSVVVGNSFDTDGERAFRWTEQTGMVPLDGSLSNLVTQQAHGASWDGEVVVGYMEVSTEGFGAFYWTAAGGTRWLTDVLADHGVVVPDGWRLYSATAVSAEARTIVGYGVNPQGFGEGFVAYLGPACRADYDESGSVNTADVIAYLGAWSQRSIFADWNYDGYIDTRDVIGFLGEWVAKPGC